jgi:hypothetical protein
MRSSTIEDRFRDYLEMPTVDKLFGVRELVLDHSDYDPYAPFWSRLVRRFGDNRFEDVVTICQQFRTVCCLSPRFHFFWGVSAAEIGDFVTADDAKASVHILLNTLMKVGDGSVELPYRCTYVWDATDILQALGVQAMGQQLVTKDERRFDILRTETGEEFWFDVTDVTAARRNLFADRSRKTLAR